MPQYSTTPEIIIVLAIWLTAILVFAFMLVAALLSLASEYLAETKAIPKIKLKLSSVTAKLTKIFIARSTISRRG